MILADHASEKSALLMNHHATRAGIVHLSLQNVPNTAVVETHPLPLQCLLCVWMMLMSTFVIYFSLY